MEKNSYLVFSLFNSRYGVRVPSVREILLLPELTPVTEAPPYISGLFNFRGRIIPVMDLHVRFGYKPQPYHLEDRVIVLELDELIMALIVNEVFNVQELESEQVESPPTYGQEEGHFSRFFEGLARLDEDIIHLLNFEQLVHQSASLHNLFRDERDVEGLEEIETRMELEEHPVFMPQADEAERKILHKRAKNLLHKSAGEDFTEQTGLSAVAVVELGGEVFGVELEYVTEFTELKELTPVPCCPPHIVGCMNLRGAILTVVDIASVMGLSSSSEVLKKDDENSGKAIVSDINGVHAGIMVEEVLDVRYITPGEKTQVPAASRAGGEEYLKWTFNYENKNIGLLDLKKIILEGDLVVNETV